MAKLFFSLRDVPSDEADDVRALLDQHRIRYYETSSGNWGISMPALWLNDDDDFEHAVELLANYQIARAQEQRAIYQQLKQKGQHRKITDSIRERPLLFILSIGFCAIILYISIRVVIEFGL